MVFQQADDQLFMPTVFEDVAFGPANQGLSPEEVSGRVRQALEDVGAAGLAERQSHRLSGGQKRSVAIAAVLAMLPEILVMDEPSSGLDPKGRRRLIGLLARFTHTRLVATHDLDLVMEVCPRTIVLHEGRLAADGPTREIFGDEKLPAAIELEVFNRMIKRKARRCSQQRRYACFARRYITPIKCHLSTDTHGNRVFIEITRRRYVYRVTVNRHTCHQTY